MLRIDEFKETTETLIKEFFPPTTSNSRFLDSVYNDWYTNKKYLRKLFGNNLVIQGKPFILKEVLFNDLRYSSSLFKCYMLFTHFIKFIN
jgi:hypothetical protein